MWWMATSNLVGLDNPLTIGSKYRAPFAYKDNHQNFSEVHVDSGKSPMYGKLYYHKNKSKQ